MGGGELSVVRVSPVDAAWLLLESRDTPMHVGGLMEFTRPADAGPDYLKAQVDRMRTARKLPQPWNLRLVGAPVVGERLPLMQTVNEVDLDLHVRHSALPHPGGQRELGVLVSRLHGHPLDLHRPLWEVHVIEGLEDDRFAIYMKIHHSLIDGTSAMRMLLRALSTDPADRETPAFWTVGPPDGGPREHGGDENPLSRLLGAARDGATALGGLGKSAVDLAGALLGDGPLRAPFSAPSSALGGGIEGQRRFATQQYELSRIKALAKAGGCTLNDVVLYLCSTALRRYLTEHAHLPGRSLTAMIPVNLRGVDDNRPGTAIGFMVADLASSVGDPLERLQAIKRSTAAAKEQLASVPHETLALQALALNGPYIAGLLAGLQGRAPTPANIAISNVPGPAEPLYFNGSRLDAIYPVSLLLHGNALNITCVSYAGTLNFGLIGARDTLPHLQRLAIYLGDALEELSSMLLPKRRAGAAKKPSGKRRTQRVS